MTYRPLSPFVKNDTFSSLPKGVTAEQVRDKFLYWEKNNKKLLWDLTKAGTLESEPSVFLYKNLHKEHKRAAENVGFCKEVARYFNDEIDYSKLNEIAQENGFIFLGARDESYQGFLERCYR